MSETQRKLTTIFAADVQDYTRLMGADEEGTYIFTLINPDTLDYCYSEAGAKARAVCGRLLRQR